MLAVVFVLTAAVIALTVVLIRERSKTQRLRSDHFDERSLERFEHREMLTLVLEETNLGSVRDAILELLDVLIELGRVKKHRTPVKAHILSALRERVRQVSSLSQVPELWSAVLIRGLGGHLAEKDAEWTVRALEAWARELRGEIGLRIAEATPLRERACV